MTTEELEDNVTFLKIFQRRRERHQDKNVIQTEKIWVVTPKVMRILREYTITLKSKIIN